MAKVVNRDYELVEAASLVEHPDNPRRGHRESISESISANGFYGAVVAQWSTRRVLAGNHRLREARAQGIEKVPTIWVDCDDEEARRILLADNRTNDLAWYDERQLADVVQQVLDDAGSLIGTGWDEDSLASLVESLGSNEEKDEADRERDSIRGTKPNRRALPLDVIFSHNPRKEWCWLAWEAGWKLGAQSTLSAVWEEPERWRWRFPLTFIDNEFKAYDHEHHKRIVGMHHPKYATTRDLMTRKQCAALGIDYYDFETVMAQAEEMRDLCENVIVIPKYDCIKDIPDHFVLGYSVPTSYGGTPLPAKKFRGRRVHLLGGSWKSLLGYLALLGDDVVSFDTNWICHIAMWGQYALPDGRTERIREGHPLWQCNNQLMLAIGLSLGNIATAIHAIYPEGEDASAFAPDLVPQEGEPDEEGVEAR